MKSKILNSIEASLRSVEQLKTLQGLEFIDNAACLLTQALQQGGKILIAGNGGSLCDAAHFAEELTGFFRKKRQALPAIALTDPGHITCVGNDLGFDSIFSRSIEALGRSGDIFIGLTTSGNSPNMLQAFAAAEALGLQTIAFLGKGGGALRGRATLELLIEGITSDRIQEAHMTAMHIIIEMMEEQLFYSEPAHEAALCER